MRTATVRHLAGVGLELRTPYDADFIAALKAAVPHFARKWVPERKVWLVSDEYRTAARQLLQSYFTVVDLDTEEPHTTHRHSSASHAVLHLLPTAPPELIKAAFYCLAKLYHPDRGGDLATMQKLNAAYEKLQR